VSLLDRIATLADSRRKTPERERVDTDEKAMVRDREFGSMTEFDPDEIQFDDYRKMMLEPQVKSAVRLKILGRISTGWDIVPASEDAQDQEIAEFVKDQLEQMEGTTGGFMQKAMMATVFKTSIHEVVYRAIEEGRWKGKIGLRAIKHKKFDPEKWRIVADPFGNLERLEQNVNNQWKALDPWYFVIWCHDHDGDFFGKSDLKAAYRYWKAKDHIDKFWNVFVERAGMPTPIGKYPEGAGKPERKSILTFLSKLGVKKAAVIPQTWQAEFLEAKGNGQIFERRVQYCDRMMGRSVLLPQLLLDEGESGSYSLGKQHSESFRWVIEDLGETFAQDIFHEQLVKRLVTINWTVDQFPRLVWRPMRDEAFADLAAAFCALVDKGIADRDEPIVRERLGLPARQYAGDETSREAPGNRRSDDRGTGITAAPPTDGPNDQGTGVPGSNPSGVGGKTRPASGLAEGLSPLAHADKCNFAEIELGLDDIETRLAANLTATFAKMRDDLIASVRKKGIGTVTRDQAAADTLQLKHVGTLKDSILAAFGHAIHQGALDVWGEIDRGLSSSGVEERPSVGRSMKANMEVAPLAGSGAPVDTLSNVIRFWRDKVPVQKGLLEYYERQAFTIAGAYRNDLLLKARNVIGRGLLRGATASQMEFELARLFDPYIAAGGASDELLAPGRLHNIVRTNVAEAYNSGRMNLMRDEEVWTFIEAFEYSAVLDTRTTPFCASWHGQVIRKDDPALSRINPPNHYQCRSVLIPIVTGERFAVSKQLPGIQPQDGFNLCEVH